MINIREAKKFDLQHIVDLHTQSWRDNYASALTQDYLTNRIYDERLQVWQSRIKSLEANQLILVAEIDEQFCGFICAYGNKHAEYGTVIDNLHVKPDVKGQGVGTQLLKAAATWANNNYPALGLYLEVLACNVNAIGYYESLGAKRLTKACWHAPCGSMVDEYVYGWNSPKSLTDKA